MSTTGIFARRNVTNIVCQEKNIRVEIVTMKLESVSLAVYLVGMASTVARNAVNNAM